MADDWITTGEAARLLGLRSVNTVKRLIREGRVRAIRPGAHYRVSAADVAALAARRPRVRRRSFDARDLPAAELRAWANRHGVTRVTLFGSAARGQMRPDSDLDVVVDLHPDARVGLMRLSQMQHELEEVVGRPVDLGTWDSFRPRVRREAERHARVIYEG